MPPLPSDVLHSFALIAALFTPTLLGTKYAVQLLKGYVPVDTNGTRLFALAVGAVTLAGLALFFAGIPSARVGAVEAVCGAAAGGAAIADYHLIDILRGFGVPLPTPPEPTPSKT